MKIHSCVVDKKKVRALVKKVGLNKINTTNTYSLHKTGEKVASPYGYGKTMDCGTGNIWAVGFGKCVWIALIGPNTWFKTSPVLSCTKIKNGFKIETKNSHYELRKIKS